MLGQFTRGHLDFPANLGIAAIIFGCVFAVISVTEVTTDRALARADSVESACADFTPYGQPANQSLLASIGDVPRSVWTVICYTGHVAAFNLEHNVSDWVAYRLNRENLLNPVVERKEMFRPDPSLPENHQVTYADYTRSGYDRGHLAPAAAMRSQQALDDTCFTTNIAPQIGSGFNRGIWKSLERKMRQWACERGELYIVTGPLYEFWPIKQIMNDKNKDGIDDNGILVDIPSHFFKLAFDPARNEAIAFILPNKEIRVKELQEFLVSIDDIETRSSLDILPELEDTIVQSIANIAQSHLWETPSDTQCRKLW